MAIAALIGWQCDIDILKRGTGSTAMNPLSAVCFVLLGLESARLLSGSRSIYSKCLGLFAIGLVLATSIFRLMDVNLHTHFELDKILFTDKLTTDGAFPNQMAPNSAFCFFCLSIIIFLLRFNSERAVIAAQLITVIPVSIGLVALLGYGYGVKSLYSVGLFVPMAVNSAVVFILLSFSIWVVFPKCGLAKVVIDKGPAGHMARLLLPTSILIPAILGWLGIMGIGAKLFNIELGVALAVATSAATLFLLTFFTASQLYSVDLGRKQAEQHLNDFYALLAHELRSPLTSIGGSIALIMSGRAPEEAAELLASARLETHRMLRLINDLLDLKKIQEGRWELKITSAEPSAIVANLVDGLQGMASMFKVSLTSEVHCSDTIQCDSDRLQQVLTNLVSNAIKVSPPDSEVLVSVIRFHAGIKFSVTDTGPGIAIEQSPKLFAKFEQLGSSDTEHMGTGLGLFIAKAIVQQHGGQIGVDSKLGQGSTFWFILPI